MPPNSRRIAECPIAAAVESPCSSDTPVWVSATSRSDHPKRSPDPEPNRVRQRCRGEWTGTHPRCRRGIRLGVSGPAHTEGNAEGNPREVPLRR